MDSHGRWHAAQIFGIALAAFCCALLVVLLSLALLRHFSLAPSAAATPQSQGTLTDQQKLDILASLSSTSSVSIAQRSKVLRSLSSVATTGPTEAEKLKILQSLQAKP